MTPRNRRLSRDEIHASIITTAREIAAAEGWSAVTVRKVAQRIGYTAPIIYEHFGSKDEMLNQVLKTGYDMLYKEMVTQVEQAKDAEGRVKAVVMAYWHFAHDAPELYQLMYGMEGARATSEEARDYAAPMVKFIIEQILHLNPEHAGDKIGTVLVEVWSIVHGMISLDISGYAHRFVGEGLIPETLTQDVLTILKRQ